MTTSLRSPKLQRLHDALSQMIHAMKPGDRMPSEPELARQLSVSRATLREAMRIFETQGLIHRRQGSGTFVSRPSMVIESGLEVLESIEKLANRIGLPVALGDLSIETRFGSEQELAALDLPPESQVISVKRVILAEGQPAAYLVDILPSDLLTADEIKAGFSGSVLDLLLRRQEPALANSRCEISATTATSEIARAMAIQRGDVLLCFEAWLYSTLGKVVDYSFSYFLPGYFKFHVARQVG